MSTTFKNIFLVLLFLGNGFLGFFLYFNSKSEQLKGEKTKNKLFVLDAIFETNRTYLSNQLLDELRTKFEIQHRELSIIMIPKRSSGDKENLDLELKLSEDNEILNFDYFKP